MDDRNLEEKDREDEAERAFEQDRRRGEEMRQWQAQERAERLQALSTPVSELARRLLMAHPDWEIQEQIHLDHASLEARARPEAEAVVVECRWAEDARWRGMGAVEASVARFTDFRVVGTPDSFEYEPGWPSHVMEPLVQEVEQEVVSQALIAAQDFTCSASRPG